MGKALTPIDATKKDLAKMAEQFGMVLPEKVSPQHFVRVCQTAISNNPELLQANKASLYAACMKAAEDGLLPDGKEAAFVKFKEKIQYMPMIAGIRKKVRLSGEIRKWDSEVVCDNDDFDYELGDNPKIYHKPCLNDRGQVIAAYSIVTFKDGEKDREVMDIRDIEKVRACSRAKDGGPWKNWYEEMCRKTVARRHSKRLPMEESLTRTIEANDDMVDFDAVEADQAPPQEKQETSPALARAIDEAQDTQETQTTKETKDTSPKEAKQEPQPPI